MCKNIPIILKDNEKLQKVIIPEKIKNFSLFDLANLIPISILMLFSISFFIVPIKLYINHGTESLIFCVIACVMASAFSLVPITILKDYFKQSNLLKKGKIKYIFTNKRICICTKNKNNEFVITDEIDIENIIDIKILEYKNGIATLFFCDSYSKHSQKLYLESIANPIEEYKYAYKLVFNETVEYSVKKLEKDTKSSNIWYIIVIISIFVLMGLPILYVLICSLIY